MASALNSTILRASFVPPVPELVGQNTAESPEPASVVLGGNKFYVSSHSDTPWPRCGLCDSPLVPYARVNLLDNSTPTEFRDFFSDDQSNGHIQLLGCSDPQCFETGTYQEEEPYELAFIPTSAQLIAADNAPDHLKDVYSELEADGLFLPNLTIRLWELGRLEVPHRDDGERENHLSDDEYETHEPLQGVKLLGYPVMGKFKGGKWINGCRRQEESSGDTLCAWRCLLQLGSGSDCVEEGLDWMDTTGNMWIMQCETHEDVLELGVSGTW